MKTKVRFHQVFVSREFSEGKVYSGGVFGDVNSTGHFSNRLAFEDVTPPIFSATR